jgi:hypothetical protein
LNYNNSHYKNLDFANEKYNQTYLTNSQKHKQMLNYVCTNLDMVCVETLHNRVLKKSSSDVIEVLPLASSPVHILLLPSKAIAVVHRAQYELNIDIVLPQI